MRIASKTILTIGAILLICTHFWGCKGGKIPVIGEIQGPSSVNEYAYVEYSISLTNATDVSFLWSCDPPGAGDFDDPALPKTGFTASEVKSDTPVRITVVVSSDQFLPVVLSKNITITDITKLSVGEIEGPNTVEENSSETYGVTASGDTGITYRWSTEPDGFGSFDAPQQAETYYLSPEVESDTEIEIRVEIHSDNYDPVIRFINVVILNIRPDGWARTWGGSWVDCGYGVAVDSEGNVSATGLFFGTVDFDPGPGIQGRKSMGGSDIYIVKYSTNGDVIWVRTIGGEGADGGYGISIDDDGNAVMTGFFTGTVDFDPGPGIDQRTAVIFSDIFVCKFDNNGNLYWVKTFGGDGYDFGYAITNDKAGNVYLTSGYEGVIDFDPGPGVDEHHSNGESDVFLSKYDKEGNFIWVRTWGGVNRDFGLGITADIDQNVYITGYFRNSVDFDPCPEAAVFTSEGGSDAFLSKFNAFGEFQWARVWGGDCDDVASDVAVDKQVNPLVIGYFRSMVDFNPGPGIELYQSIGGPDIYFTKFERNGEFLWTNHIGGLKNNFGHGIAIDNVGNILITGSFMRTMDFDPGLGVDEYASNGAADVYIGKYNSSGDYLWAKTWGGSDWLDWDEGYAVAVDYLGNAYITGRFYSNADFDPGPGIDEHTPKGKEDVFLSKFPPDGNW